MPDSCHCAATPAIRSLSVGARHRARRGGAASISWTKSPASSRVTVPVAMARADAPADGGAAATSGATGS